MQHAWNHHSSIYWALSHQCRTCFVLFAGFYAPRCIWKWWLSKRNFNHVIVVVIEQREWWLWNEFQVRRMLMLMFYRHSRMTFLFLFHFLHIFRFGLCFSHELPHDGKRHCRRHTHTHTHRFDICWYLYKFRARNRPKMWMCVKMCIDYTETHTRTHAHTQRERERTTSTNISMVLPFSCVKASQPCKKRLCCTRIRV